MNEGQQAKQLIEQWVRAYLVPKIVFFLGASEYVPDETVQGLYGIVRLHRTVSGQMRVRYSNQLIGEVLSAYFGEKYLVQHPHQSGKSYVLYITPKD